MKKDRVSQISFLVVFAMLLALLGGAIATAQEPDPEGAIAAVDIGEDWVVWRPQIESAGFSLTISGPDGFYLQQEHQPNNLIILTVKDGEGNPLPSGIYQYELYSLPLAEPIEPDDEQRGLDPPGGAAVQSGSFSILDGSFVTQTVEEGEEEKNPEPAGTIATEDQVILDDLIVNGSACIGQDCVNGESFGFDTLRLKENNLRIHFQDTSSTASFPTTDWTLVANDSSNGGASYFAIQDRDAGRNVFLVGAGAPSNALYVESGTGDIGLGTSTPVVDIDIKEGDTPTVRLDQDGTSGWAPQVWDVAGNEANFFIRDATNGSQLPFRIQPGASTNALTVRSDGRIGVGTWSPDAEFDIEGSSSPGFRLTNTGSAGGSWDVFMNSNTGRFNIRDNSAGNIPFKLDQGANENLIQIGVNDADQVDINGDLVVSGQCSETDGACAPDYVFAPEYEMLTLAELKAYIAAQKHLPNVPSGVELDTDGVNVQEFSYVLLEKIEELTLYILQQEQTINELEARLEALEGE